MARQKSLIKLEGTIGDLTFYKSKSGGYLARERGGISADRIANDPAFQRTRENGAEFGRAGAACKLFRSVFRPLILKGADNSSASRLMKLMMTVIHADTINVRGQRMVLDAETELLQGYEFNANASINTSVFVPFDAVIDRAGGSLKVNFPLFNPAELIAAPAGATHFKFKIAAAMIDFENVLSEFSIESSPIHPLANAPVPAFALECALTPAAQKPLFLCLGVDYFQRVNNVDYLLNNGTFNGLSVIKVSGL